MPSPADAPSVLNKWLTFATYDNGLDNGLRVNSNMAIFVG